MDTSKEKNGDKQGLEDHNDYLIQGVFDLGAPILYLSTGELDPQLADRHGNRHGNRRDGRILVGRNSAVGIAEI
jgi:hypothetical protein